MPCAVLLLVFNRPDLTRRALHVLKSQRIEKLYIAADGPRPGRVDDIQTVGEVREIIAHVDWPCDVKTLVRESNLGCKQAVSRALDWFFLHEEEGIILEDDCVPIDSFFPYCEELLSRFRCDERVAQICGTTYVSSPVSTSYWFSKYPDPWGWACWRRSWLFADMTMRDWPQWRASGALKHLPGSTPGFVTYWTRLFDDAYAGRVDTWDYAWMLACWQRGLLSVLPATPQIQNVGFGADATHCAFFDRANPNVVQMPVPLTFPLRHNKDVAPNIPTEREIARVRYSIDDLSEIAARVEKMGPIGRLGVDIAKALRRRATGVK